MLERPKVRPVGPSRREARSTPAIVSLIAAALVASCGDDATTGPGTGGTSGAGGAAGTDNASQLAGTASQNPNCASLSGATAAYFDFESGFLLRLSFPPLLESIGGTVAGGDASFWSFPPGYSGQTIPNGATIQRDDGRVFFKQSSGEQIFIDTETAFSDQLATALATFEFTPDQATLVCGFDTQFFVGPLPGRLISGLYDAGGFRFIVKVQVIDATALLSLSTRVAVGPSSEFDALSGNVFLPMVWQQFPGGSGPDPRCSDRIDNDGDLLIDFPEDPECESAEDNDERQEGVQ